MTSTTAQKRERFAALHEAPGCFAIPNPWDVGSAKFLSSLGFKALATTSAGMAFAAGRPDNGVNRAYALKHIGELAAATELPLNADFEAGFASDPEGVYESAKLVIGAGVAGFSIEDYTGNPAAPIYSLGESVARLRAARAAINESGERVLLTARSECVWVPNGGGLSEALRRLAAFAQAGADVLFAPGVRTREDVSAVVGVAGKLPVNVVVGAPGLTPGAGSCRSPGTSPSTVGSTRLPAFRLRRRSRRGLAAKADNRSRRRLGGRGARGQRVGRAAGTRTLAWESVDARRPADLAASAYSYRPAGRLEGLMAFEANEQQGAKSASGGQGTLAAREQ